MLFRSAGGIEQLDSQPAGILDGNSTGNQRQISHLSYLHALVTVCLTVMNNESVLFFVIVCYVW